MARIDFRAKEPILQAFEREGWPSFIIYQGTDVYGKHSGSELSEAATKLEQYLDEILESGTICEFQLKMYPANTKMDKKTEPERSVRFTLTTNTQNGYYRDPNSGNIIVLPQQQGAANKNISGTDTGMQRVSYSDYTNQLNDLRRELENEKEKRHQAELEALRNEFKSQIAGIQQQTPPEKDWQTRLVDLGELLIKDPNIAMGWKGFFLGNTDFRTQSTTNHALGRTSAKEQTDAEMRTNTSSHQEGNEQTETTVFLTEFLSPEELKLKRAARNKTLLGKMNALLEFKGQGIQDGEEGFNPDAEDYKPCGPHAIEDIITECMENLHQRGFSPALMATFFLVMQEKDDDDINSLFNHLF